MKLSKSEENIMKYIWQNEVTYMKDIMDALPSPKPAPSTISTLLKRMQEKGYITYEKSGSIRAYRALVSKKTYFKNHVNELIEKFFENSTVQFASFFAEQSNLTDAQLKEIRNIIDHKIKEE